VVKLYTLCKRYIVNGIYKLIILGNSEVKYNNERKCLIGVNGYGFGFVIHFFECVIDT